MPNHVENIVTLSGSEQEIRRMLKQIQSDEFGVGTVDFNKIIPMPWSLNIEAGGRTDRGLRAYRDFIEVYTLAGTLDKDLSQIPPESEEIFLRQRTDIPRDEWELGKTAWNNLRQYGAPTWYDWCVENWGTKWNAYGYDEGVDYSENDTLRFQTAWAAPHPILEKLAVLYPGIIFEHEWADEDLGRNCGRSIYADGERIEEYFPEGVEAMDFALRVWDYDPIELDLMKNKTGTGYVRIEDESYDLIEVAGIPALFSGSRMRAVDIPEELYVYDLRKSSDGRYIAIEPRAAANYGGSIVTQEPIDFGGRASLPLDGDTAPDFTGEQCTFGKFMRTAFSQSRSEEQEGMLLL